MARTARAIWTGTVGFGLVQIPVSLHAAEDKEELDMTLLDKRNFSAVGYQRVNKRTGKEVPWEQIVKGYEHAKGEYVVLSEADFKAANAEATRQVDILDFVEYSSIDPRFLVRPYYLAPQKSGRKAYALLRETLRRSDKAGNGKIVIRTRQHIAAHLARDNAQNLVLLRFADELRDERELDLPETNLSKLGVTPKEVQMAEQLVASMVTDFEPKKYVDEYRRDLTRLIQRKVKAGDVNQVPEGGEPRAPKPAANVIDLSSLLANSLSGGKSSSKKTSSVKAKSHAHPRSAHPRKHATHRARATHHAARRKSA
jgi:DNA end-binding protein Ku